MSALFSLSLVACIGAPGIPAGPLQGTGVSFSGSYGYAASPARVLLQSDQTGQRASYRDYAADALNFPIFPTRLGGRLGITDYFDLGTDLSWLDGGVEFRLGLPEGTEPLPLALSFSLRRGHWGLLEWQNRKSHEQRLRLEAYPRLVQLRYVRLNLIASAGLSTGRRYHPSIAPNRFQIQDQNDEYPGPSVDPEILRDETRLEGTVGIELRQGRFFISFVLMPYVVVASDQVSGTCGICDHWRVTGYDSSVGAALYVSAGVAFTVIKRQPDH